MKGRLVSAQAQVPQAASAAQAASFALLKPAQQHGSPGPCQ